MDVLRLSAPKTGGRAWALKAVLALFVALSIVPMSAFADAPVEVSDAAGLQAAFTAGGDIKLTADIDAGERVNGTIFTVPSGKTVNLNLNGFTIEGTRSGTGNFQLVENSGSLTIMDSSADERGRLAIDADVDHEWNSLTAVVTNRGSLTLESGSLINLGGTAMAYCVDNNSTTSSPVLTVNGGKLESTYIAVRQFANSTTYTNDVIVNGGEVKGATRGLWIQQPSNGAGAQQASIAVTGGKVEGGSAAIDVYMMRDGGVTVNIAGGELANNSNTTPTINVRHSGGLNARVEITDGSLRNSGTGGNLRAAAGSTIEVSAGTFSDPVPPAFLADDADPEDIVVVKATTVTAEADVAYMLTIPAAVDFGKISRSDAEKTMAFNITVSDALLEDSTSLVVTEISKDWVMYDKNGAGNNELPFDLDTATFEFSASDLASGTHSIPSEVSVRPATDLKAAGDYLGYMTFRVAIESLGD